MPFCSQGMERHVYDLLSIKLCIKNGNCTPPFFADFTWKSVKIGCVKKAYLDKFKQIPRLSRKSSSPILH